MICFSSPNVYTGNPYSADLTALRLKLKPNTEFVPLVAALGTRNMPSITDSHVFSYTSGIWRQALVNAKIQKANLRTVMALASNNYIESLIIKHLQVSPVKAIEVATEIAKRLEATIGEITAADSIYLSADGIHNSGFTTLINLFDRHRQTVTSDVAIGLRVYSVNLGILFSRVSFQPNHLEYACNASTSRGYNTYLDIVVMVKADRLKEVGELVQGGDISKAPELVQLWISNSVFYQSDNKSSLHKWIKETLYQSYFENNITTIIHDNLYDAVFEDVVSVKVNDFKDVQTFSADLLGEAHGYNLVSDLMAHF